MLRYRLRSGGDDRPLQALRRITLVQESLDDAEDRNNAFFLPLDDPIIAVTLIPGLCDHVRRNPKQLIEGEIAELLNDVGDIGAGARGELELRRARERLPEPVQRGAIASQ